MANRQHLDWFRLRLAKSALHESRDPAPILAWLDDRRAGIEFRASLIALDEVQSWGRDDGGNVRHQSGQFFGVEGVLIEAGGLREVRSWGQPILTQPEGGVLAMVARESHAGIEFLLQAKAEPGNIGTLQLVPSLQCTWSNIRQIHHGTKPPLTELLDSDEGVRRIYSARHNEEGGRFWQKSNENVMLFLENRARITSDLTMFHWASQNQIKELALMDNVLSPFVKTIMAPL